MGTNRTVFIPSNPYKNGFCDSTGCAGQLLREKQLFHAVIDPALVSADLHGSLLRR